MPSGITEASRTLRRLVIALVMSAALAPGFLAMAIVTAGAMAPSGRSLSCGAVYQAYWLGRSAPRWMLATSDR